MAASEITSLVCDLHGGEEATVAAPVWLGIGGQLYQLDVCPGCAARLRETLSPFLSCARLAGSVPSWLPRPDAPAGRAVNGPTTKRDLILSVLRARIADGTYPAGSYLPTQRDLAEEHGMSAQPVHDACCQLWQDGLIRSTTRGRYIIQGAPGKAGASAPGQHPGGTKVQLPPGRPAAFNAQGMRAQRERAGLTLWELRGLTGIPRTELQAYESSTRQPRPHRVVALAQAFGVRPLALMNRDVIGRGLASLRVTAGLCQQELSTRAGISALTLRNLENGTTCQLDWPTAKRIAMALRTSPEAVRRAHNRDVIRGRTQNDLAGAP